MERIKGVNVLKAALLELKEEILFTLSRELVRIGRAVAIAELKHNPFGDEIGPYVDEIGLDKEFTIMLKTAFADTDEKSLRACISELEIDAFGLIDLLELLKSLPGKNGVLPSVLTPVTGEYISNEPQDRDAWTCLCGNTPDHGGFYSCDEDGDHIEPGNEWEFLYRCNDCGRVIDDRDHSVIGINLNPNDEEVY